MMKTQRERREEMGAYGTMIIIGVCCIACIAALITALT